MKEKFEIETLNALTILQALEHDIINTVKYEKDINYKRLKIRDLINAHEEILSQSNELQKLLK